MPAFLCITCGTQYPESDSPPPRCFICDEERQYVGLQGQQWTTIQELRARHTNEIFALEPGFTGILTKPAFAINQRAILVESAAGNLLWDCVALLDDSTAVEIERRGGLRAIAISHPHYYTTMIEWARRFQARVYLHGADRQWVARPDESIEFWEGETLPLWDGMTLIRCGGHFEGGTVLHRGVCLLSGDIIQVVSDRRWVSFMYSYPNYIPLNAAQVRRIAHAVEPFAFDRIYGAFHPLVVAADGNEVVRRSAARYLKAIE